MIAVKFCRNSARIIQSQVSKLTRSSGTWSRDTKSNRYAKEEVLLQHIFIFHPTVDRCQMFALINKPVVFVLFSVGWNRLITITKLFAWAHNKFHTFLKVIINVGPFPYSRGSNLFKSVKEHLILPHFY